MLTPLIKTALTLYRVHQDIQATIFCRIVASDPDDGFNFIFEKYKATPIENPVKARLLNALACSNDHDTLQKLLDMTLDLNSGIDSTHAVTAIQRVAMNSRGRALVLDFLQKNLQRIITVTGGGINSVLSIVSTLASNRSTQKYLDKVCKSNLNLKHNYY